MRVVWSKAAIADLRGIRAYIGQFNPYAARDMAVRLVEAGDSLGYFPHRGRTIAPNVRELTVVHPYIIRYCIADEAVFVLRVRHGMRHGD